MDVDIEYYVVYYFPTEQYIPLDSEKWEADLVNYRYYAIVLRVGCPPNCPELGLPNKDMSLLHYVLDNTGELFISNETAIAEVVKTFLPNFPELFCLYWLWWFRRLKWVMIKQNE